MQVASANQSFNLLQGKAVLHVMPIFSIEIVVLYEILLGLLTHLSMPTDDILVLYFHHDLSLGSVWCCKLIVVTPRAPGGMWGLALSLYLA